MMLAFVKWGHAEFPLWIGTAAFLVLIAVAVVMVLRIPLPAWAEWPLLSRMTAVACGIGGGLALTTALLVAHTTHDRAEAAASEAETHRLAAIGAYERVAQRLADTERALTASQQATRVAQGQSETYRGLWFDATVRYDFCVVNTERAGAWRR